MPNSDNQDGVHNKQTKEIRYYEHLTDSTEQVITQSFSGNVETAKAHFFHADALTCNDTNGTQLDYAITADGNGIKFTIAFGTKGAGTAEADDWSDTWTTTKASLVAADKWIKPIAAAGEGRDLVWRAVDATPHLF